MGSMSPPPFEVVVTGPLSTSLAFFLSRCWTLELVRVTEAGDPRLASALPDVPPDPAAIVSVSGWSEGVSEDVPVRHHPQLSKKQLSLFLFFCYFLSSCAPLNSNRGAQK